jgi:putative membrane protein
MFLYPYIKALHIIFIVTWFAGLFYIVRLFVYHVEADAKEEPDKAILKNQYTIMENRLWSIITWPSMVLTVILGVTLVGLNPSLLSTWWFIAKLGFVVLLIAYHLYNGKLLSDLQADRCQWTSTHFRMWNEGATLLLVAIVFLAVLKQMMGFLFGVIGLIVLALLLMLGIRLYRRVRQG